MKITTHNKNSLASYNNPLLSLVESFPTVYREFFDSATRDFPNDLGLITKFFDYSGVKASSNYPPYNVIYGENAGEYTIEVALAGFSKDDLEVEFVKDKKLTIRSVVKEDEKDKEESLSSKFLKRGIGKRSFTLSFTLPQYSTVDSCKMQDGLLIIDIKREIPEDEKPKLLDIL